MKVSAMIELPACRESAANPGSSASAKARMTAGRGFVAIAIVVLGRWHPVGVAVAALVFGAATALQFVFQAMGLAVPYQLFLLLPYVLTLLALAGVVGRVRAPAGLGRGTEMGPEGH